jgi:hypothetical protein
MNKIKMLCVVALLCTSSLGRVRLLDGPHMAQTLWAKQTQVEFVIITTLPSMEGETSPVGEICASEWVGRWTGFNLDVLSCHDAIPYPIPPELK